jgi:biopolymer transport protein ExbB
MYAIAAVGITVLLSVAAANNLAGANSTDVTAETVTTLSTTTVAAASEARVITGSVTFIERLRQGGWTMIFLLFASIVAVSSALERLVHLRRRAINPLGLFEQAQALWAQQRYDDLLALCDQQPSTLAAIIRAFVRHRHSPTPELSMLAGDIAGRDLRGHLQKAYPIAVAATVAPLLGLFGTVIGMIEAFEIVAIAGSLGDASLLAGSISKALVTTAAGLIIAIPALATYHYFKSRTHAFAMALESDVNELLTTWFMDQTSGPRSRPAEHA